MKKLTYYNLNGTGSVLTLDPYENIPRLKRKLKRAANTGCTTEVTQVKETESFIFTVNPRNWCFWEISEDED